MDFSVFLIPLLFLWLDLCAGHNDEGIALLRFRERVELDPYGALSGWGGGGGENPCERMLGWESRGTKNTCFWENKLFSATRNLSNLCLKGILVPELGKLIQLKSLVLCNNSFYGVIPREIAKLQKLEVLDLGYNHFSGLIPLELSSMMSLEILVLRNNMFVGSMPTKLHPLSMMSELEVDKELLLSKRGCIARNVRNAPIRRLMQIGGKVESRHHHQGKRNLFKHSVSPSSSPSQSPSPSPSANHLNQQLSPLGSPLLSPSPSSEHSTSPVNKSPVPSPVNEPPASSTRKHLNSDAPSPSALPISPSKNDSLSAPAVNKSRHPVAIYMPIIGGFSFLLALSAIYFLCFRSNKAVTIRPWSTGLSGQLQKAFVADGVPALRRSELESACEDFSNVIDSLSDCMLYKGTLSNGVEIAVASSVITSAKDWSKDAESQFRNKISTLSRVNHKNFMNLLGYCEEEETFTRMMVFEYTPNGTLFEHLHIKEAEHLDWAARLRIAMGIAYCLEYMQQLEPPILVQNLNSSSVYLTEDYAAKVSDLAFFNQTKEANPPSSDPTIIVYKFGILLLEILSGRRPFSGDDGLLVCWASCYFSGKRPLQDMLDPTLKSFRENDLGSLSEILRSCVNPDPSKRPTMAEVTQSLRHITSISHDAASPRLSPLWWAELEILSTEAN
ncbi:hypothetical protein J5N97_014780 [Dioscorea zingiberensis]|uniref:Protein kinase domain-containing protein n=1 Tax=Dioscorea zingiberensis TaxID=325984 RepID=A0A9D5HK15_9LILI|nr:hypothetical protein J5N97_014780 [Dioscorea zingiberensis]